MWLNFVDLFPRENVKKKEEEKNRLFIERPCKLHFYIFGKLKAGRFQKYILLLGYLNFKFDYCRLLALSSCWNVLMWFVFGQNFLRPEIDLKKLNFDLILWSSAFHQSVSVIRKIVFYSVKTSWLFPSRISHNFDLSCPIVYSKLQYLAVKLKTHPEFELNSNY